MAPYPRFRCFVLLLVALTLAGCAGQRAYREANDLIAHDHIEGGLIKYREAIAADPGNAVYRLAYLHGRDTSRLRLLEHADRELAEGKVLQAQEAYRRILSFAPSDERALAGLRQVDAARRHATAVQSANAAFQTKQYELARQRLQEVLSEQPRQADALALLEKVEAQTRQPLVEPGPSAAYRKPISLEFHDAPLRQVLEVVSRHSRLNFVFDKDVRQDQRVSIFLKDSTVEAALYFLLMTNQLDRRVMDRNTILIYPNTPAKQKEYQEMVVKTFYLANAEAKSVAGSLKTVLKSRDIAVDEKLNLVILRDNPEGIKLASRMVSLLDLPEPEVMLDVEVMEVQRNRMTELGVTWPSSVSLAPLTTANGTSLTIEDLHKLTRGQIGVSNIAASINAHKEDGDSTTLANPRIRVRNKEKAKVVIGDRLPTITTTISSGVGGFASESVTYVDVGLTLNVEPTIGLDNDVAIRISLEVSNLVDSLTTKSGSVVYRIGSRSATTLLQLKDGENQVLAGLIKNEDRSSGRKLPILGDIPLLGRLFGSTNEADGKTEIVLSITPHLVRNILRPPADQSEFAIGGDGIAFQPSEATYAMAEPVVVPAQPAIPSDDVPESHPSQPTMPDAQGLPQPTVVAPMDPAAARQSGDAK